MAITFEFDPEKSAANRVKHGIAFEEATAIWADPAKAIVPSKYPSESRWIATGLIGDKLWSAIFTYRVENIRLISVRRARPEEAVSYDEATRQRGGT